MARAVLDSCWFRAGFMLFSCWFRAGLVPDSRCSAGLVLGSCWSHAGLVLKSYEAGLGGGSMASPAFSSTVQQFNSSRVYNLHLNKA